LPLGRHFNTIRSHRATLLRRCARATGEHFRYGCYATADKIRTLRGTSAVGADDSIRFERRNFCC